MKYQHDKDVMVVAMEGEVDFSNSNDIKMEIRRHLNEKDKHLVLDLRNLEFIDSSGVGVMISLLKTVTTLGRKLILADPIEEVAFVLKMTKIDQLIEIKDSVHEALESLRVEG